MRVRVSERVSERETDRERESTAEEDGVGGRSGHMANMQKDGRERAQRQPFRIPGARKLNKDERDHRRAPPKSTLGIGRAS